jgi:hypothetical protein
MNCFFCHKPIPEERLEALPNTDTCIKCSKEKRVIGITQGGGSMSGSTKESILTIVKGDNKLARSFINKRRGRSWGKGVGGGNLRDAGSQL